MKKNRLTVGTRIGILSDIVSDVLVFVFSSSGENIIRCVTRPIFYVLRWPVLRTRPVDYEVVARGIVA